MAPSANEGGCGLYWPGQEIFRPAAYFRGSPTPSFPLETALTTIPRASVPFAPDGFRYVYAGQLSEHYGHFLFTMLSRLWALPQPLPDDLRLVMPNAAHASDLFQHEFARALFAALGITLEHFAVYREPVRFRTLEVPSPAIEENHLGHRMFATMCHRIGRRLLDGSRLESNDRLVFLTKMHLRRGVHHIVNEGEFCNELERRGVQIVSPETLPFADQLALWAERPIVGGIFGSMMHTSVFFPRRTYVALNPEVWINSNQVILDRINDNVAHVVYPREGYYKRAGSGGFGWDLSLKNPARAAKAFFNVLQNARRRARSPRVGWRRVAK